jgi:hypothetical protein
MIFNFLRLTLIFFIFQSVFANAADTTKVKQRSLSVTLFLDLTYTGYHSAIGIEYQRSRHTVYLGPKISLTNNYLLAKQPFGGILGYRYYFLKEEKRFKGFINLDYQLFIYKAFKGQQVKSTKENFIHEINISYGAEFRLTERISLGNSIGIGKYFESYFNYRSEKRFKYDGYNALVRLYFKYDI